MRICGVEIKGSEAVFAVWDAESCAFVDLRRYRVKLVDDQMAEQVVIASSEMLGLLRDADVDVIFVKDRPRKGRMCGSACGFKLEALLQLDEEAAVHIVKSKLVKSMAGTEELAISFSESGLRVAQEMAFLTAMYGLKLLNLE